ncbi:hypothetical protein KCU71_g7202, partial [Aureobasidium melanogenum]
MSIKRKRVTCLYNVQQYSDIVVAFNNRKVFAHKAILAASSSYFHRAFPSKFAVASNAVIDLGDDDDPDLVEVMLRIIYDDEDVSIVNVAMRHPDLFKAFLDFYVLGDRYDVPVLRHLAKEHYVTNIKSIVCMRGEKLSGFDEFFEQAASSIARILGPSAITVADRPTQEEILEWCAESLDDLLWFRPFRKLLGKGQMLSTEFAGRLFLKKARHDAVEFGSDHDNDVYDHSSEFSDDDDDDDDHDHRSESEAEEEDGTIASASVPEVD